MNKYMNTYKNIEEHNYTAGHANAKSDDDASGKGTGVFMDTFNGGSVVDIEGNGIDVQTGRVANLAVNKYNKTNGYVQKEDDPTE